MPNRLLLLEEHGQPPSTAKYMMRALRKPRPRPNSVEFPAIVERWSGFRIEPRHANLLRDTMGVGTDSVLYPHVAGFRLQMAALTHPACPLPIWNALQIRNHMIRHRPLERDVSYVLETSLGAQRLVEKGLEVDLETRLLRGGQCDWESVVTYFYRGRFGGTTPQAAQPASPDLSGADVADKFVTPGGGRWAFGSLTGDYNGIHLWDPYARRFDFKARSCTRNAPSAFAWRGRASQRLGDNRFTSGSRDRCSTARMSCCSTQERAVSGGSACRSPATSGMQLPASGRIRPDLPTIVAPATAALATAAPGRPPIDR